jgi:hypothetical protein
LIGLDLTALAGNLQADCMMGIGPEKPFESYPTGGRHLGAEGQWKALVEDKYERPDGNGGKHRGSRDYIV